MKNKFITVLRAVLLILGLFLIIDAIVLTFISNFTLGIVFEVLLGALFAVVGIRYDDIKRITSHGALRIIKYIVLAGVLFTFCVCAFTFVCGNIDTADGREDIIMVLGCGVNGEVPTQPLAARLDAAVKAYSKNSNAYILVSGGKGPQEDITEADAMEKYLLEKGIDKSKIIKEDRSTSTSENYKYSKEILDLRFHDYKIAVITNDFHIYRAKSLAKKAGLDVTTIHAKTPFSSAPMMYLREVLAILKLWILRY